MRWKVVTLVAGLLTVSAGAALAQGYYDSRSGGLEIIPFAGYRWGGGMSSISGVRSFDTQDNVAAGVALDFRTPGNSAAEIYWSHFAGDINATLNNGTKLTEGPLQRDDIMLNGIWYAYRANPRLLPYFSAGLGGSIFSTPKTASVGRFAWNIGAGLRRDIGQRLGIRADGRWMLTWVTTGTGMWCDPYYGCYSVGTGEYYDQFELTGGLILRLGGR